MRNYVVCVDRHFVVNELTKEFTHRQPVDSSSSSIATQVCSHDKTHHKGSSARYIRTTCVECGQSWNEERNKKDADDPELCLHTNVDHRGSTKHIHRAFCIECKTCIDEFSQEMHKSDVREILSPEEESLAKRMHNCNTITIPKIMKAIEFMVQEVRKMKAVDAEAEFRMIDIVNMFVDQCDRAHRTTT